MLRPQDVGRRVVVRKIIGVGGDRPLFTDLLGLLAELTETELTVLTRHGPQRVARADVHRSKLVPPTTNPSAVRAARREADEIGRLELTANESWPAAVQHRLGDWLLRATDGWTGRANSALPLGDPGRPLAEAVDAVDAWYAEHGLPAQFNVPLPAAAAVATELAGQGWQARPLTLVQTAQLTDVVTRASDRTDPGNDRTEPATRRRGLPPVRLDREPSDEWLAVVAASRSPGGPLPPAAHRLLTGAPHVRFAHLRQDGELVAVARATVSADRRWCAVALLAVTPAARRHGLATHVLRAVAGWAHDEMGARHAFLQVEQRNPATALYLRLGFTTHHVYLPWRRTVSGEPPGGAC
ncbi:GNAT family N-acetyltransferase [Micromonospora sp. LOL_023]|uniref:GNAT family N-acetyltransferase n=1 Tax=Micromonospora sp. LOL_023 TaxID=3345418 RepID=UPI003A843C5E